MANMINLDRGLAGRGRPTGRGAPRRARRRIGLAAIALLALALATGAAITLARPAKEPGVQQATSNPIVNDPYVYTQWDFREDPRVYAPLVALDPEQQERTQVAPGAATEGTFDDYAAMPAWTAPAVPVVVPDPWAGTCRPGIPDCREDEHFTPGGNGIRDYSQLVP